MLDEIKLVVPMLELPNVLKMKPWKYDLEASASNHTIFIG